MAFAHEIPTEDHSRIETDAEASHELHDEVMLVLDAGIAVAHLRKPHESETGGDSLVVINGAIGWRRIGTQLFPGARSTRLIQSSSDSAEPTRSASRIQLLRPHAVLSITESPAPLQGIRPMTARASSNPS